MTRSRPTSAWSDDGGHDNTAAAMEGEDYETAVRAHNTRSKEVEVKESKGGFFSKLGRGIRCESQFPVFIRVPVSSYHSRRFSCMQH